MDENSGGPAFPAAWGNPEQGGDYVSGMSLRDWFAGQALAGVLAGYWANPEMGGIGPKGFAEEAYEVADAMLAARNASAN